MPLRLPQSQQPLAAMLLGAALLLGRAGAREDFQLSPRSAEHTNGFDRSALGNLKNVEALRDLQVPRHHLFSAPLLVGSPPQRLSCLLDTGTADLWLPSKRCTSCDSARRFHAERSTSFMPAVVHDHWGLKPVPVQVSYGSGSIDGFLAQDHVSIAQHKFPNQSFIIVEEEDLPRHRDWDGVCGLGWRQLTDAGLPLYRNKKVDEEVVFSLVPGFRDGSSTLLSVGDIPHDQIKLDTLAWAPVESLESGKHRSYWIASAGVEFMSDSAVKARILLDTASAYLLAPRKHYRNMLRLLLPGNSFDDSCGMDESAGNLVVCDCEATLDSVHMGSSAISVQFGGRKYSIGVNQLFKRVPDKNGGTLCLLMIQQSPLTAKEEDPFNIVANLLSQGLQEAGKAHPHVKNEPVLPPFPFQGLAPVVEGKEASGGAGQNPLQTAEEVEEIEEVKPNGTLCTTTLVWAGKHLKRNSTSCQPPGAVSGRRLNGYPLKRGWQPQQIEMTALPLDPAPEPLEDVWVLGGAFLDHFAVFLDFEHRRLGLAEPLIIGAGRVENVHHVHRPRVVPEAEPQKTSEVSSSAAPEAQPPTMPKALPTHPSPMSVHDESTPSFPWTATFAAMALLAGAAGVGHFYRKTGRRKNFRADDDTCVCEEDALAE